MNTIDLLLRRRMMMEGRSPEPTPPSPPDYRTVPLTFEAMEAADIIFGHHIEGTPEVSHLEVDVSTDGGATWATKQSSADGTVLASLQPGEKMLVRATNARYNYEDGEDLFAAGFDATGNCYLYGNIMSLVGGEDFENVNEVTEGMFASFFKGVSWLHSKDGAALELPATTLAKNCYNSMFSECTGLTTAPALPATTLAENCYNSMFQNCTALTEAPALPATTLAKNCYNFMFYECTSLEKAPDLPAASTVDYCYYSMFFGCTVLNSVKCLIESMEGTNPFGGWLHDVAATGTFTKKAGVTWPSGADGIPSGWTVVEV